MNMPNRTSTAQPEERAHTRTCELCGFIFQTRTRAVASGFFCPSCGFQHRLPPPGVCARESETTMSTCVPACVSQSVPAPEDVARSPQTPLLRTNRQGEGGTSPNRFFRSCFSQLKAPAIILALQFAILLTGVLAGWDAVARLQKRVETAPVFADPLRNATTAVPVDVLDLPRFGGNAKKTEAPRREIEPKNVGPVAPKAVASPKTGSAPKAVQNKTAPPKKSGTSPADALHPGKKTQVMRSPFGTEMLMPLPEVDAGIDTHNTR